MAPEIVKLKQPPTKAEVIQDIAKIYGDVFKALIAVGFSQDQALQVLLQVFPITELYDDQ